MAGNTQASLAGNSGDNHELEHLIHASAEIAGDDEIIIIGSQAILGQFRNIM